MILTIVMMLMLEGIKQGINNVEKWVKRLVSCDDDDDDDDFIDRMIASSSLALLNKYSSSAS